MLSVTEDQLQGTGLPKKTLDIYRLAYSHKPPWTTSGGIAKLAKEFGFVPKTIRKHLARVYAKIEDPNSLRTVKGEDQSSLEYADPESFAATAVALSDPGASVAAAAREAGVGVKAARAIQRKLASDQLPLKRELEDIRLEELTKRFGTLTRDAMDAITPEKLQAATAKDLTVIAGISADKWQLLRGQPTQRMEIGDRRQMDEVLKIIMKEAARRGIEIDVTPEGGTTAKKSLYKSAIDRRMRKDIMSGDPAETLAPA